MDLFQHDGPVIFAHRGASCYAPENTLAAFELALGQGAPAVELDAMLCADGHVVVFHDSGLERITGHSGQVAELPLAELQGLDAGSHFDIAFKGEPIPTLSEVFEAIGERAYINIELKNYASPTDDLPEVVVELIRAHNLAGQILFSSFNPLALRRARRALPETPIGLLAISGFAGAWSRSWPGRLLAYDSLHPERGDVTHKLVESAHRRGQKVFTYTVNDKKEMGRLFNLGVDGIITDDPILALRTLEGESP